MTLTGLTTALATPFDPQGQVDLEAWEQLLQQQLSAGVQGLVVAGSTGEAASLTEREYESLLQAAVSLVAGHVPILAGTGLSSTSKTIALTRRAANAGADYALVVTPPYVRPTQRGLVAHYQAVAEASSIPIVVYNVPSRTGCDLLPETLKDLANHPGIAGIKEATAEPNRMRTLCQLRHAQFVVLSGDDGSAAESLLAGADGVISVLSNVLPRTCRRLWDLVQQADVIAVRALCDQLAEFYQFCTVEPNPVPIKALLHALGVGHGTRLPLVPLAPQQDAWLGQLVGRVAQLEASDPR